MEEKYTDEQLDIIDEIVAKLEIDRFINGSDLGGCKNGACWILENKGWIKIIKTEQQLGIIRILPSTDFDAFLAGGTFSERYYRKLQSSIPQTPITIIGDITATNSSVAIGSNITQSLDISLFDEAIEQIKNEKTLLKDEKEEIIDILKDIEESKKQGTKLGKTLTRNILKWTVKAISLGGSVATIFQELQSV